ncbi:hypothetical protein V6N11_066640 [Hibiscus sabdariffa]|uniref:Secreted protein n=2 Tax=Hibiscus sabdariffa TaxID=183260 RepID=A0ABR2DA59_9ROSI
MRRVERKCSLLGIFAMNSLIVEASFYRGLPHLGEQSSCLPPDCRELCATALMTYASSFSEYGCTFSYRFDNVVIRSSKFYLRF